MNLYPFKSNEVLPHRTLFNIFFAAINITFVAVTVVAVAAIAAAIIILPLLRNNPKAGASSAAKAMREFVRSAQTSELTFPSFSHAAHFFPSILRKSTVLCWSLGLFCLCRQILGETCDIVNKTMANDLVH